MKELEIKEGYIYLPDHNILINKETLEKYRSHFENVDLPLPDPQFSPGFPWQGITKINQVTFQVTKDCNLRCVYCQYNNNYSSEWNLTDEYMDFETARRTLDYFYDLIKYRPDKRFRICFYGGEPLVAFELIKKIVNYSKEVFSGWIIQYFMTTNGTLFTDDIIDYLIAENFSLMISLDGSQKNHDAKRVYHNGKGTFSKVWQVLHKIKNKNADYFDTVRISAVHSYEQQSILDMYNFFVSEDLLAKTSLAFAPVSSRNTDYYKRFPYDREKHFANLDKVIEKIADKLSNHDNSKEIYEDLHPFEYEVYKNFLSIESLNSGPRSILGGACDLYSRPFIDTKGTIHMCERINNRFPIGDIYAGYNFDNIDAIREEYIKLREQECMICDVKHLCNPCFVFFMDDGFFSIDKNMCKGLKEWNLKLVKTEIQFNEKIAFRNSQGIYKFHQFIKVHEGPVNSAIINLLTGDIYQVPTHTIESFIAGKYEDLGDFITEVENIGFIIKVNPETWIPNTDAWEKRVRDELESVDYILLHLEDRLDTEIIEKMVKKFKIASIKYYGTGAIDDLAPGIKIFYARKDFGECRKITTIAEGTFEKIVQESYQLNKICNTCWGHKIAITRDGKIRPCIYSNIEIADIKDIDDTETIEKIKKHWFITKDQVERCKDCEFRYVCPDCREIAQRQNGGNIYAANPNCNYSPYSGIWENP